jgi:hypothetical protein
MPRWTHEGGVSTLEMGPSILPVKFEITSETDTQTGKSTFHLAINEHSTAKVFTTLQAARLFGINHMIGVVERLHKALKEASASVNK